MSLVSNLIWYFKDSRTDEIIANQFRQFQDRSHSKFKCTSQACNMPFAIDYQPELALATKTLQKRYVILHYTSHLWIIIAYNSQKSLFMNHHVCTCENGVQTFHNWKILRNQNFYASVFLKLLIRSYKSDKSLRFQVERLEMRLNDEF